jgi:hypothetical protein
MRHVEVIWYKLDLPITLFVLIICTNGSCAQKRNIKFIVYKLIAIVGLNENG